MCSGTYYIIIGALSLPTSNFASPRRRGTIRFSLSFILILTPISNLLGFLYYWCTNLGLNNARVQKLGLLEVSVPVPL